MYHHPITIELTAPMNLFILLYWWGMETRTDAYKFLVEL